MFGPRKPPVAFGSSAPYRNEKGQWKVLVTIDNSNQIERDATADEIAAEKASAPAAVAPAPAAPPKKPGKGKKA